ncbi:toll/interleukin-1 receptor domain-containing protein [Mucilaginibacter rubeus]|uniref:TIR domain-containing protein n=1 Tax=Mucilaginibacter rubeus TaxID=2027860 RepID=A0A5C1I6B9_9SPHI|nr:toll/interleukin-1 receptor domain-containing protein [Mucilaginibacter rubeus]QEM13404.1 hypothetical protein DEO27_026470 [Mucilaginibacter rubeus]
MENFAEEPVYQNIDQETIDFIVDSLIGGKCILFLGPELLINDSEEKHYKVYFKEIAKKYPKFIYKYFSRDNVFAFQKSNSHVGNILFETKIRNEIKQFYETGGDDVILNLISQLPFPLIINVAPDNAINKIFTKNNFSVRPGYYPDPSFSGVEKPTTARPVIYNIFGSIEEPQSIILTHEELFKTIKNLMQEDTIPENIVNTIKQARCFIFLGMRFETWYYQLLLSIFDIEISESIKLGAPKDIDDETVSIMDKYFRINFTKSNSLEFISKIYKALQAYPEHLRTSTIKTSTSAYLSYAWEDAQDPGREYWVDRIDRRFRNAGVKFSRDKSVLTIQDSIQAFMNRIGQGRVISIVVSEKYLFSEYCMYEAWSIFKNDNFLDRAFILILPDVDFTNKEKYIEYWQSKTNTIRNKLENDFHNDYLAFDQFMTASKNNFYILLFINQFLNILTDRIWPRILNNIEEHQLANEEIFKGYIDTVLEKLTEE